MLKYALYDGERDGELLVHHVRPGELIKTASSLLPEVENFVGCLRPDDRYTYTLVNAMGYSEYFGANSNTDWYGYNPHLDFNGLLYDWPGIGENTELDKMRGKQWPHGYPCFYNAAVFAHHRNTDPVALGFGDVQLAVANPRMKRIELVLRVSNEEAAKKGHGAILSRIRNGERCDVSMGARVPYDACSICTDWETVRRLMATYDPKRHIHKGIPVLHHHQQSPIRGIARTRAEYCDCMKRLRGRILPDGRKVFVYNDHPRFFDISFVWVGADRTARVMWHLRGDNPLADAPAEHLTAPKSAAVKLSSVLLTKVAFEDLRKIGEMDKEITGGVAEAVHRTTDADRTLSRPELERVMSSCGGFGPALSTLAGCGVVLRPEEFQRMMAVGMPELARPLNRMLLSGRVFDSCSNDIDDAFAVDPKAVVQGVMPSLANIIQDRSSYAPFLGPRMKRVTIISVSAPKAPAIDDSELSQKIAALYNGYRLSVVEQSPALASSFHPLVLPEEEKYASLAGGKLLGILLGTGSLVSLLSSHLRKKEQAGKELGVVGKFIANHPTLSSALTAGAGLRLAMGVQAAGGIANAASALVTAAKTLI